MNCDRSRTLGCPPPSLRHIYGPRSARGTLAKYRPGPQVSGTGDTADVAFQPHILSSGPRKARMVRQGCMGLRIRACELRPELREPSRLAATAFVVALSLRGRHHRLRRHPTPPATPARPRAP